MREIKFRGKAIMSIEELELIGIEHDSGSKKNIRGDEDEED